MSTDPLIRARRISFLGVHAFASGLVVYALGGATSILIARALGPFGRGIYVLPVTLVAVIATMVMMGVNQAQMRLWSNREGDPHEFVTSGVLLAVALGGLGMAIAWAIFLLGGDAWFEGVEPIYVLVVLPVIPLIIHSRLQQSVLIFAGQLPYVNLATIVGAMVQTGGTALLFSYGQLTVGLVLLMYIASMVVPWAVMNVKLRSVGRFQRPLPWRLMRSHLALGTRMGPAGLFQFINHRVDIFLVGTYVGVDGVGTYSVAVVFSEIMWLITNAVTTSVSERQANAPSDEAIDVTARAVRMNVVLSAVVGVVIAAIVPVAIPLLYGSAFRPAISTVWILLFASCAVGVWRPCSSMLARFGSPTDLPVIAFSSAIINVGANIVLLPRFGLPGAGVASVLSYGFGALLSIFVLTLRTPLSWKRLIPARGEFEALRTLVTKRTLPAIAE